MLWFINLEWFVYLDDHLFSDLTPINLMRFKMILVMHFPTPTLFESKSADHYMPRFTEEFLNKLKLKAWKEIHKNLKKSWGTFFYKYFELHRANLVIKTFFLSPNCSSEIKRLSLEIRLIPDLSNSILIFICKLPVSTIGW